MSSFDSPFLLGFDQLERIVDRVNRSSSDGYPPYNIERLGERELRIVLAVAGFEEDDLSVTLEHSQLVIRGRKPEDGERQYLHRGIAARQFQRTFVLAEGVDVTAAKLENGLLSIDLEQPASQTVVRNIEISNVARGSKKSGQETVGVRQADKSSANNGTGLAEG